MMDCAPHPVPAVHPACVRPAAALSSRLGGREVAVSRRNAGRWEARGQQRRPESPTCVDQWIHTNVGGAPSPRPKFRPGSFCRELWEVGSKGFRELVSDYRWGGFQRECMGVILPGAAQGGLFRGVAAELACTGEAPGTLSRWLWPGDPKAAAQLGAALSWGGQEVGRGKGESDGADPEEGSGEGRRDGSAGPACSLVHEQAGLARPSRPEPTSHRPLLSSLWLWVSCAETAGTPE